MALAAASHAPPPKKNKKKTQHHHCRALAHTPTQSRVINSVTQTPVNANEAKTNPFLLMVCLRFYHTNTHTKEKKSFFTSSCYHRPEQSEVSHVTAAASAEQTHRRLSTIPLLAASRRGFFFFPSLPLNVVSAERMGGVSVTENLRWMF